MVVQPDIIRIRACIHVSQSKPCRNSVLTEGLDYLYGDKLAAMLNYCGSDISEWSAELKNGLSGTHVRQRPGYAQIGYVESQAVKRAEYKNEAGALLTPALNAAGDLNLSFRAMAARIALKARRTNLRTRKAI